MGGHSDKSRVGTTNSSALWGMRDDLSRLDGVDTLGRVRLGEVVAVLLIKRSVEMLLKERVNLIHLKLGLEVREMLVGKAVGAATSIGEAESLIHDFFAGASPVAFTTTVLLDLLGVNINVATLGEEARQVFCWRDTAIGNALVVTVVVLVRTSHFDGWMARGDKMRARRRRGKTEAERGGSMATNWPEKDGRGRQSWSKGEEALPERVAVIFMAGTVYGVGCCGRGEERRGRRWLDKLRLMNWGLECVC